MDVQFWPFVSLCYVNAPNCINFKKFWIFNLLQLCFGLEPILMWWWIHFAFMMYRQFHELKELPLEWDHYHFHEICELTYYVEPVTMRLAHQKYIKTKKPLYRHHLWKKQSHYIHQKNQHSYPKSQQSHLLVLVQWKQGTPNWQLHWWAHQVWNGENVNSSGFAV